MLLSPGITKTFLLGSGDGRAKRTSRLVKSDYVRRDHGNEDAFIGHSLLRLCDPRNSSIKVTNGLVGASVRKGGFLNGGGHEKIGKEERGDDADEKSEMVNGFRAIVGVPDPDVGFVDIGDLCRFWESIIDRKTGLLEHRMEGGESKVFGRPFCIRVSCNSISKGEGGSTLGRGKMGRRLWNSTT